jgi:hypothetical protein
MTVKQQPFHLDHRLLGISLTAVRVLFWWEVRFEDRFEHQHRCCHADPIAQGWHVPVELHSFPPDLWIS